MGRRGEVVIHVFMLFDGPDKAALRLQTRPAHKAYLAQVADRIAFAGPLLDTSSDGEPVMIGSLLAVDFPSHDAAMDWLSKEPFTVAGVYARSDVRAFQNLWPQKAGFPAVG